MEVKYKDRTETTPFVFRVKVGGKFYIGKSSKLSFLHDHFKRLLRQYKRGLVPETDLYYPIIEYAHRKAIEAVYIEVLFTSANGYDVVKRELEELLQHFGKRNCLNANRLPHIPKPKIEGKATRVGHWITPNELMNAHKLLNKHI